MSAFPMKQAGALIGQCMPEFAAIVFEEADSGVFACYSLRNQKDFDGKQYPKGKLLKSIRFKEPSFDL